MTPFHHFAGRLRRLCRRRQTEAEMLEEMRFHLEARAADLADEGLSAEDARYAARRKFGNAGSIEERAREARGWGWLERALKDLRLGVRQLARNPGFSALAIVTLGLGIGANTAMFSVLNGIILKPLPFADVDGLDRFYRDTPQNRNGSFSAADILDFQRAGADYGHVVVYGLGDASLGETGAGAEMVSGAHVSVDLFSALGTPPQLGRDFRKGEDTPGHDRVVVLSQRLWLQRFGGKPDVLGRSIRVDGEPHEIVGVLPASFNDWRYFGTIDVFRPLAFSHAQQADRVTTGYRMIGRRAADRSRPEAEAFVADFGRRQAAQFPAVNGESSWRIVSLQVAATGRTGPTILPMLIGLSGFVLLIACSNLANLLLARTIARAREFAVRAALGASRTQLLRPLIVESLLLALAGSGVAILSALWFRDWAAMRSTGEHGEHVYFALDWHVAGWAFTTSLVTAVAFGLAPALFALRLDLNETLKSGGRGATGNRGHQRFRQFLIIGQFALAMVLLAGAGLFIRGLHDLNHRREGWQAGQLVTGSLLLPPAKYDAAGKIVTGQRLLLERVAALPGIAAASFSTFTPFFNWPDTRRFLIEGQERPARGREPNAAVNRVSPGYFDAFDTRVLSGRAFLERDNDAAPRAFILGQSTARAWFGDGEAVGRRLGLVQGTDVQWGEIVGVVSDVKSVDEDTDPRVAQVYQPLAQEPARQVTLAVRTSGAVPAALVGNLRATLADFDSDVAVRGLQHAEVTLERANYDLAVLRDILGAIALLGLGLASLGIYGVIARTMAQRMGEFAIRLALGASVGNLTRIVLSSGVKLALLGSTLGLAGAVGVARILGSAFPGMDTGGLGILIGTTLLLVGVALLACWLPARRAGKVDAVAVLRAE